MKSGASQTFHFNQSLAEKQEKKHKKRIPILWSPTSTMSGDKNYPIKSYPGVFNQGMNEGLFSSFPPTFCILIGLS